MSELDTLFERLKSRRWEARKAAAQAMVKAGGPAARYLTRNQATKPSAQPRMMPMECGV